MCIFSCIFHICFSLCINSINSVFYDHLWLKSQILLADTGLFSKKGKIILPRSNTTGHDLVHLVLTQQRNGANIAEVLCFINNSKCGFSWGVAWDALVARLKCSQDMDYIFSCDMIRVMSVSLHGNSRGGWNSLGLPSLGDVILTSFFSGK